jgi:hypothetical protein
VDSGKFTKTVTMSLVALAAATGAAVLEAGAAAAETGNVTTDSISIGPGNKIPGLTNPALKIAQKVPGLKVSAVEWPALKIAQKVPALKIPGVIHKVSESPILTEQQ